MPKAYTREQLWKLYKKLPEELQEAIFSVETADNIYGICERNNVGIEKISSVATYVGNVLVGVLPPEELQETLEKEVKLEKAVAKKVAQEINRFIFYPVRPALEQLYKVGVIPAGEVTPSEKTLEKPSEQEKIGEEKLPTPARKDTYREPIE